MALEPPSNRSSNPENQFSRSSRIQAMQEMASAISFDLTDMVTVINHKLSQVKNALGKAESKDSALKDLETIQLTLERMGKMAKGLRSLGLMGAEEGLQVASVKELLSNVVSLSQSWFESKKVGFHADKAPAVKIRCRPAQISQALINLLNNALEAVQAQPEKWVSLTIELTGESPQRLRLSVTDSGKISAETASKMMEPFFSTKPPGQGLGLGLNVTKTIAEAHSGKLFLDSQSPTTRFVFEVPVCEA